MLLTAILKAITQIEKIEDKSEAVDLVLQELKDTVNSRMRENLMELMTIGEQIGYDEIKKQLNNLSSFVASLEQK